MMRRLLPALLLITLCLLATPPPAKAFGIFQGVCTKTSTNTVCADKANGSGKDPIANTFVNITHIVAFVAGAAAIIFIVVGGLNYITSGGDPAKVSSAKGMIVNSLIGVVVIVLAQSLITYVVNRL